MKIEILSINLTDNYGIRITAKIGTFLAEAGVFLRTYDINQVKSITNIEI